MERIVGIILVNRKGDILLILRANDPSIPAPNKWDIVGGHVEPGESLEQALLREVEEEICFHLESYGEFGTFHDQEAERYVYIGPIGKELDELCLREGQSFGFFSPLYALNHLELGEPARRCLTAYVAPTSNPLSHNAGKGAQAQSLLRGG
jgi:8-oxo-dGTP diphosphatase